MLPSITARPFDYLRFVPEAALSEYARSTTLEKRALLKRVRRREGIPVKLDSRERALESEIYSELLELDDLGS